MSLISEYFWKMERFTQSLCLLIVSTLSLCGATEYYVRPSEPTNTSCPAQPCLTVNEYARHSETYFTSSNTEFRFLPGPHLLNTSITVRNVHNVSFTSLETEKSPQIVFYKWSQCNNVSCDQLEAVTCTPFGFWNATSATIDRLSVLVYPQSTPIYCLQLFGITFSSVSQLHLHHCNISVVNITENTDSSFGFCNSIYFSDSQFVRVIFSTIICYEGSVSLMKSTNIEIANSTIVGGIESALSAINNCLLEKTLNFITLYISKSRNISVSRVFVHSGHHSNPHSGYGISIRHTNHTRIAHVTLFNSSGIELGLFYNIDTEVLNTTIMFFGMGIYINRSINTALQDVYLWHPWTILLKLTLIMFLLQAVLTKYSLLTIQNH